MHISLAWDLSQGQLKPELFPSKNDIHLRNEIHSSHLVLGFKPVISEEHAHSLPPCSTMPAIKFFKSNESIRIKLKKSRAKYKIKEIELTKFDDKQNFSEFLF